MAGITRRDAVAATVAAAGVTLVTSTASAQPGGAAQSHPAESLKSSKEKMALLTTTKTWRHATGFASLDAVVTFVNTAPAQGAGEAIVVPAASRFDVLWYA